MTEVRGLPRLLIAGLCGGSGKTLASLGLLLSLRRAGVAVRAFKKGPDYIDAAWLSWASAHPARNLDTFLMGSDVVFSSFARNGIDEGINVIEGARGLFDGFDVAGTHSSAVIAKLIQAPVLLVVDATKVTRTTAAMVLGCQKLDPEVSIRGVILNNVNGRRHKSCAGRSSRSAASRFSASFQSCFCRLAAGTALGLGYPSRVLRTGETRRRVAASCRWRH